MNLKINILNYWKWILIIVLISNLFLLSLAEPVDYNNPSGLDLTNSQINLNLINWDARSQSDIPSERISELLPSLIRIEEISDKTQITFDQWLYSDNLNKADDLSKYSSAQEAIANKHGLINLNLFAGHTTYHDGKLTNGKVSLDLKDDGLKRATISSLNDGGFKIEKGASSGKFKVGNNNFDLPETGSVEITPELVKLPSGAVMTNDQGLRITSLEGDTIIRESKDKIFIEGFAQVSAPKDLDFSLGSKQKGATIPGSAELDYANNQYLLSNSFLKLNAGKVEGNGFQTESTGPIYIMDEALMAGAEETGFLGDKVYLFSKKGLELYSSEEADFSSVVKLVGSKEQKAPLAQLKLDYQESFVTINTPLKDDLGTFLETYNAQVGLKGVGRIGVFADTEEVQKMSFTFLPAKGQEITGSYGFEDSGDFGLRYTYKVNERVTAQVNFVSPKDFQADAGEAFKGMVTLQIN